MARYDPKCCPLEHPEHCQTDYTFAENKELTSSACNVADAKDQATSEAHAVMNPCSRSSTVAFSTANWSQGGIAWLTSSPQWT